MDAQNLVNKATDVANEMKKDPNLVQMMQKAKGIFIMPKYAKGGLIVGAQGGEGVMLVHHRGSNWTTPVFYDTGGLSFGAQAGVSAGSIAMLLMSDKAINRFKGDDKFALNAEAGISIIKYSAAGRATPGQPDVILWSDQKGAYAGATLSLTDIHRELETGSRLLRRAGHRNEADVRRHQEPGRHEASGRAARRLIPRTLA